MWIGRVKSQLETCPSVSLEHRTRRFDAPHCSEGTCKHRLVDAPLWRTSAIARRFPRDMGKTRRTQQVQRAFAKQVQPKFTTRRLKVNCELLPGTFKRLMCSEMTAWRSLKSTENCRLEFPRRLMCSEMTAWKPKVNCVLPPGISKTADVFRNDGLETESQLRVAAWNFQDG